MSAASTEEQRRRKQAGDRDRERVLGQGRVQERGEREGEDVVLKSLKTIFDPSTLVRKGLCPVTTLRGQEDDPLESHSLYFEMHGNGPEKVVFIMGYVYV